jgi:SulP family sulfate permease
MSDISKNNTFFRLNFNQPRNLKNDVLSGLTVALALIPEAIAFSFVAGVDPRVGLYAAFIMGLITAIFGGRPGMISGATGAVAVIFAPLVIKVSSTPLAEGGGPQAALGYLFAAVILMGLIQISAGLFKLGKFVRLIPHPVMLGFVNGLAIVIFRAQFSQFYVGTGANQHLLPQPELLVMGGLIALTMAISHFLPKLTKAIPATLAAIVTVTILALVLERFGIHSRTVLDFVMGKDPSKTTIAASLPAFALPKVPLTLATLKLILPYAVLASLVGLIESLLTLTLVDELTETRGRGNRECLGQGLANVLNGFFGGMGGCAMIGQSMINIRAGGRGRTSGITAAVALLAFLLWGSRLIELIPLAALVGVMFMVVIGTFEWSSLRLLNQIPKADLLVLVLVSAITVVADLAIAVVVGIIVSALVFAWSQSKRMRAREYHDEHGTKVYELGGALFFGSSTSFKELFSYRDDPEEVVIDFKRSRVYDHSGLEAINAITEKYAQLGKRLHLLNLSRECRNLLHKAGNIIEVSVIEDLDWHLSDDSLA